MNLVEYELMQEDAMYAEEGYEDYGEYEEQYVDPAQPSSLQGDKGKPPTSQDTEGVSQIQNLCHFSLYSSR